MTWKEFKEWVDLKLKEASISDEVEIGSIDVSFSNSDRPDIHFSKDTIEIRGWNADSRSWTDISELPKIPGPSKHKSHLVMEGDEL
jgi:hypothetical protein